MPAVVLHLRIRVEPERRDDLLTFLRDARDYYEQPGGIRMRLLQDAEDENAFIEVFEYETVEAYERDEQRVAADPIMQKVLAKWRTYLACKPSVEVCIDLTDADLLGDGDMDAGDAHQGGAGREHLPPIDG